MEQYQEGGAECPQIMRIIIVCVDDTRTHLPGCAEEGIV